VGKGQSFCFLGARKEAETHMSVTRVTDLSTVLRQGLRGRHQSSRRSSLKDADAEEGGRCWVKDKTLLRQPKPCTGSASL